MRFLPTVPFLAAMLLACAATWLAAQAQPRDPHAAHPAPARGSARPPVHGATPPRAIGRFESWTAATHQEGGQTICYAFTRAAASAPPLAGRGDVVLTVTERPGWRDSVAISAGFAYAPRADVTVQVEGGPGAPLPFYTSQRSAFARDGKAAVAAFGRGRQAVAKSPGPKGETVTDTFSLRGFASAYAAILKACPR